MWFIQPCNLFAVVDSCLCFGFPACIHSSFGISNSTGFWRTTSYSPCCSPHGNSICGSRDEHVIQAQLATASYCPWPEWLFQEWACGAMRILMGWDSGRERRSFSPSLRECRPWAVGGHVCHQEQSESKANMQERRAELWKVVGSWGPHVKPWIQLVCKPALLLDINFLT